MPNEWLVGPVAALAVLIVVARTLWPAYQQMVKERIERSEKAADEWMARSLAADERLERLADAFEELVKKADVK